MNLAALGLLGHRRCGVAESTARIGRFANPRIDPCHAARDHGPILILVVFTGMIRQSRGSSAEDEGNGKSDLRLGEHSRISCSVDRLNLSSAQEISEGGVLFRVS